jgi:large subunit ribosomal protein L25
VSAEALEAELAEAEAEAGIEHDQPEEEAEALALGGEPAADESASSDSAEASDDS